MLKKDPVSETVFNIQRFSIHDGPGIRTTVFLKGGPLSCEWCHKVEGGKHIFNRSECTGCGLCVLECCSKALEISGKEMTPSQVMYEVLKDKPFYATSNGGLTISGGEPLFQLEFTKELLILAKKESLHTCIETAGWGKFEDIFSLVPYVDIFLYDYKETKDSLHKKWTGVSNKSLLENLQRLNEKHNNIILRCPVVPGINDRYDHFDGILSLSESLQNITEIHIEPYHSMGTSKRRKFGLEDQEVFPTPSEDEIIKWIDYISKRSKKEVRRN